jgi:hypothetical protein
VRAAAVLAALLLGHSAPLHSRTAVLRDVHATLTWRGSTFSVAHPARDIRITITRRGHVVGTYRPPSLPRALPSSGPLADEPGGPLRVVDFDRDGEPEVLADFYSGGAHCCAYSTVYRFVNGRYMVRLKNWQSKGYLLRDLNHDGRKEFVAADASFEYVFVAYAFSLDPIQIWRFDAGRFSDVTRSFPDTIGRHAAGLLRLYRQTLRGPAPREVRGILAAYTGDLCLLGRCATGFALVDRAYAAGRLGRGPTLDGTPAGKRYVAALRSFLRRHGYLT